MVPDFLFHSLGIIRIIANNVLQMKEAIRINGGKFDRNCFRIATNYLSFNPPAPLT